jgi:hypothetical protein
MIAEDYMISENIRYHIFPHLHCAHYRMNPVGIDPSRFILALDMVSQQRVGFGQMELKSIGSAQKVYELRSLVVSPERRSANMNNA